MVTASTSSSSCGTWPACRWTSTCCGPRSTYGARRARAIHGIDSPPALELLQDTLLTNTPLLQDTLLTNTPLQDTPLTELKEITLIIFQKVQEGPAHIEHQEMDIFLMDQVEYLLTDPVRTAREVQEAREAQVEATRAAMSASTTISCLTIRSPCPPSSVSPAATEESVGEPKCGATSSRGAQRCSPSSIGPRASIRRRLLRPCGTSGSCRKGG